MGIEPVVETGIFLFEFSPYKPRLLIKRKPHTYIQSSLVLHTVHIFTLICSIAI